MRTYFFYGIICTLLAALAISCKSNQAHTLLIGTWSPVNTTDAVVSPLKVSFLENKTAVASIEGQAPRPQDTVTYEIKNEGKMLVTTEKSGEVEEVEILELNTKNLVILSKKKGDTMRFVKN